MSRKGAKSFERQEFKIFIMKIIRRIILAHLLKKGHSILFSVIFEK